MAPVYVWNQLSYSGAGKVAPAPWSVTLPAAGAGGVIAAADADGAASDGVAADGAAADGAAADAAVDGAADDPELEHAPIANIAAKASAPRRFEVGVITDLFPPGRHTATRAVAGFRGSLGLYIPV